MEYFLMTTTISGTSVQTGSIDLTTPLAVADGGTGTTRAYTLESMTPVTCAGQTSIDFTGIPSWAKRITVMFSGISVSGTSNFLIQIGDSGGIENTGYAGSSAAFATATVGSLVYSGIGYLLYGTYVATGTYSGAVVINRLSGNTWVANGGIARDDVVYVMETKGTKTLSATLTQVRITTVNGTDTFDTTPSAGSINVMYEG
jgi:hypothetical protein